MAWIIWEASYRGVTFLSYPFPVSFTQSQKDKGGWKPPHLILLRQHLCWSPSGGNQHPNMKLLLILECRIHVGFVFCSQSYGSISESHKLLYGHCVLFRLYRKTFRIKKHWIFLFANTVSPWVGSISFNVSGLFLPYRFLCHDFFCKSKQFIARV